MSPEPLWFEEPVFLGSQHDRSMLGGRNPLARTEPRSRVRGDGQARRENGQTVDPGSSPGDSTKKLTPFERDNQRKSDALMSFRDERARRNTCGNCGVVKAYHGIERALGRCDGWCRMTKAQWATWCGVDLKVPETPTPQVSNTSRRPLFAPREI